MGEGVVKVSKRTTHVATPDIGGQHLVLFIQIEDLNESEAVSDVHGH